MKAVVWSLNPAQVLDKLNGGPIPDVKFFTMDVITIKGQDVTEEFIDIEAQLVAKKALEQQCHLAAQRMNMLYGFNSPEFFDRALFEKRMHTTPERMADGYLAVYGEILAAAGGLQEEEPFTRKVAV